MYKLGKIETLILNVLEQSETEITIKYLSEKIDRSYDSTHRAVQQLVSKNLVKKNLIDAYHVNVKKSSYIVLR